MWWARLLNSIAALYDSGAAASTTAYESIATVSVGSGGSSIITFSSIPSTYTHLQIRVSARNSVATQYMKIQANGDTAGNYTYHMITANGSTATADQGTAQTGAAAPYISNGTNIFGATILDILDYKNTNKYKTMRTLGGQDENGAGQVRLTSGLWLNTAAITSISFVPSSGSFNQYSSFALYGVK